MHSSHGSLSLLYFSLDPIRIACVSVYSCCLLLVPTLVSACVPAVFCSPCARDGWSADKSALGATHAIQHSALQAATQAAKREHRRETQGERGREGEREDEVAHNEGTCVKGRLIGQPTINHQSNNPFATLLLLHRLLWLCLSVSLFGLVSLRVPLRVRRGARASV